MKPLTRESSAGSGEMGMNRFSSHPINVNLTFYEGFPPQGLSEAQRAGSFLKFFVTGPPWGRPVGGGGNHHN